jgi:hypothetical protein
MAKKKQPYIPLYTGDYIKDTRTLSLEAKGAWSDLILFMWVNESKGVLEGTNEDFARMVGTSEQNFVDVLKELCRKKICDVSGPTDGVFKIICRRLVREAEISSKRSEAVQTRYKTSTNDTTKTLQKSDNDIDNGNDIGNEFVLNYKKEFENETFEASLILLDESLAEVERWTKDVIEGNDSYFENMMKGHNVNGDLERLARDHLGLVARYRWHDKMETQQAFRLSLIGHITKELNNPKQPAKGISKNKLDEFKSL